MKKIFAIFVIGLSVSLGFEAGAQDALKSGYFVENYNYRHHLNPAFASSRSYYALPVVGNVNFGTQSNLGIGTFLYPYNGQVTTFMNGAVSTDEFLGKLRDKNRINFDFAAPIISVGTWGKKGGFTTFEISMKTNAFVNLPYDLFDFMKNAGASQFYDISDMGIGAKAYTEIAIGHAHKITDRLNIGAKVKFLVGIADVDARIDNMQLSMTEDEWSVNAKGSLTASVPSLDLKTKGETGAAADQSQRNEIDFDSLGDSFNFDDISSLFSGLGYGVAFDLGATYEFDSGLLEGLNLSASVLDLGFISWGNTQRAVTASDPWRFQGFNDLSFESGENSLDEQLDALVDDMADMVRFEKEDVSKGKASMLACTINIGAEYEMPFYRPLSVGFLSSTRIRGPYSSSEGRFSLNVEPTKWFGFSTSYGISTFGSTWGALVNFSFPGIGLFIGADSIPTQWAKMKDFAISVAPYKNLNLNLNFGLTFNLSKVRHLGDK